MKNATWRTMSLDEIADEFVNGGTPSTRVPEYWSGTIPWITGADIRSFRVSEGRRKITKEAIEKSSTHLVPEGTVLLVTRTSVGKTALAANPLCFSQDITGIKCKAIVRAEYLARYLVSIQDSLLSRVRGSTIKGLARSDFVHIKVPVPPIETQERIARILERGETLRLRREQANQLISKIIQSVFLKMFNPRRAKSDSWRIQSIEELVLPVKGAIQSGPFGSQLHNRDFVEDGVLAIGIDNVYPNKFVIGRGRHITNEKYKELGKFTARPGDVLVTVMGTVGRSCVFPASASPAIVTKHVYRISLDKTKCLPEFMASAINWDVELRRQLGASTTGAIVDGLTSRSIKSLMIQLPPFEEQVRFAEMLKSHNQLQGRQEESLHQINELFESLMQRAFRGELVT